MPASSIFLDDLIKKVHFDCTDTLCFIGLLKLLPSDLSPITACSAEENEKEHFRMEDRNDRYRQSPCVLLRVAHQIGHSGLALVVASSARNVCPSYSTGQASKMKFSGGSTALEMPASDFLCFPL